MAASLANLDAASQLPLKVAMGPATGTFFDSPAAQTDSYAERLGYSRRKPSRLLRYAKGKRPATRSTGPRRIRASMPAAPQINPGRAPGFGVSAPGLPSPSIRAAGPPPAGRHPRIRIYTQPLWVGYGPR